ncbi:hypothetical protein RND71_031604 [Anisodus tanguticus]|uniref:Uncharacterized protein n=1 Tax=Anisodus tanguticus TaxID=243964 RepID=A0AAE1V4Y8_9SOLA|nr:hypothetical protein RND71_031604 [Anisodus tanguticus]
MVKEVVQVKKLDEDLAVEEESFLPATLNIKVRELIAQRIASGKSQDRIQEGYFHTTDHSKVQNGLSTTPQRSTSSPPPPPPPLLLSTPPASSYLPLKAIFNCFRSAQPFDDPGPNVDQPKYPRWPDPDYRKWKDQQTQILKDVEPVIFLAKEIIHSDRSELSYRIIIVMSYLSFSVKKILLCYATWIQLMDCRTRQANKFDEVLRERVELLDEILALIFYKST